MLKAICSSENENTTYKMYEFNNVTNEFHQVGNYEESYKFARVLDDSNFTLFSTHGNVMEKINNILYNSEL